MQRARKLLKMLILMLPLVMLTTSTAIASAEEAGEAYAVLGKAIGAALAIGLAGIGAGYAVAVAGAAAASATAEKPEMFGRLLVFVVLGEGIAIYGLLVAILIAMVL